MSYIGPESSVRLHPLPAEAYLTPEGYDVRLPRDAQAYLEEVRQKTLPIIRTEDDVFAALADELRAAKYLDGTRESVLSHTEHVKRICLEDAQDRPDIPLYEVELDADIHDWDEALGGDTIITDEAAEATRFHRGAANATLLHQALPANSPYMRAYMGYRWSEITGIWTPSRRLVKTDDKAAAYEFQIRDDVQAKLHAERQEDFADIVERGMPKVVMDTTAMYRMMGALTTLGEKYEEWGCKPFAGNPREIVEFFAYHAKAQFMADYEMPTRSRPAELVTFTGQTAGSRLIQKIIDPAEADEFGVIHLESRRGKTTPQPPTPSTSASIVL